LVPPELADHPRYRVLQPLGAGGMGTVYLAEHRLLKRPVALKVLRAGTLATPDAVARFRREWESAARLTHPNIVAAHDAEQVGALHFLVMEYVAGTNLHDLVGRDGPLPVARACDYVRQAALGLQHAHERGLVHRDIKPSNLMLTPEGTIKVLDFGLARFAQTPHAGGLTETGVVMGTPDFMAPEQAQSTSTVDIRADIYSLGCTLYYLLTGEEPYTEGNSFEKLLAHQKAPPPDVARLRGDVPAEVRQALARMMAKDPARRYATPAEVAEALAGPAAGGGDGVLPAPGTAAEHVPTRRLGPAVKTPAAPAQAADDRTAVSPPESERLRRRSARARRTARRRRRWLYVAGGVFLALVFLWAAFPPVWFLVPPPPWGDRWMKQHAPPPEWGEPWGPEWRGEPKGNWGERPPPRRELKRDGPPPE
jgi:hypothetical protein